ncbi:MAG: glycosyltransferase family 4 protein [Clostridia bacterium]|nr:glycosyltransferase family 4 protein [Clostridia bacterium]
MKAAFYLDNKTHGNIDYSDPQKGNPGIGGSQFIIWLVSCSLSEQYSDIEVYLLAENINNMPAGMKCVQVSDVNDAVAKAAEIKADVFVCRGPFLDKSFYDEVNRYGIKTIIWSHNYEYHTQIKYMESCKLIAKNVCVGREQYERLRDTGLYKKSTYIYNTINFPQYNAVSRKTSKKICYIGSLYRVKGFGRLARVWPEIEKRIPDAELVVLGSGRLYDKKAKQGRYGLAEAEFEREFMRYLTDKDGNIKSNVHFMGVVGGQKKLDIMSEAAVGVVNPTGKGETYCIGAVEFQALEVPVVTVRRYALLDTVNDGKTGLLFSSDREFVDNVVRLAGDEGLNRQMGQYGRQWVNEKFELGKILRQWHDVLIDVYNDTPAHVSYEYHNKGNNLKWLRELNRRVKKVLPFMPSIIWYESLPHMVLKKLRGSKKRGK